MFKSDVAFDTHDPTLLEFKINVFPSSETRKYPGEVPDLRIIELVCNWLVDITRENSRFVEIVDALKLIVDIEFAKM